MEDILEEKLKKKYNLNIHVKFKDFRLYEISVLYVNKDDTNHAIKFVYQYDVRLTEDANIEEISKKLDNELANIFKKKE